MSDSSYPSYSTTTVAVVDPMYNYTNNEQPNNSTIDNSFEIQFWRERMVEMEQGNFDFKIHQLPLARIKKVMKSDPDVKMISAEAPILFSKGCDTFITELTLRAWKHAVENKRRTLQRSDIVAAISKSDMFDFLIDIVPREEFIPNNTTPQQQQVKTEKSAYLSQPQQHYEHYASSYAYSGLPPSQTQQYIMNDPNTNAIHHQQQQQQQLYIQQQLMNQQMYNRHNSLTDQQPTNNTNNTN